MRHILLYACLFTLLSSTAICRTWYITPDGTGDAPTIQAGVELAAAGDTVLVAPGTYSDCTHMAGSGFDYGPSCVIMKSGLTLCSESGFSNDTFIDAGEVGRVFYCDGVDNTAKIAGITIMNGYGEHAGGVECVGSSLTIESCRFVNNFAQGGGASIGCMAGSNPSIVSCTFDNNSGMFASGIYCKSSSPTIVNCVFQNGAAADGGAITAWNGPGSSLWIEGCTFLYHSANDAGAIYLGTDVGSTILNCRFVGNNSFYWSGAIYISAPDCRIANCEFEENEAGEGSAGAGAVYCNQTGLLIENCTISRNHATEGSGGLYVTSRGQCTMINPNFA